MTSEKLRKTEDELNLIRNRKGKMIVPLEILDQLEPLGLAVWHCDVGQYDYSSKCITLSTNKFGLSGTIIIKEWFKEKFGMDLEIQKIQNKFGLKFNVKDTKKFISIIKPAFEQHKIPKCMWYKIGIKGGERHG